MESIIYSQFETELQVRPDDIDANEHVHSSRYIDFVLAARFDQMTRCYKMSMADFLKRGFGWVIREAHVEYKRPLTIGDSILVRTKIVEIYDDGVKVHFEILRKASGKLSSQGYFEYTMIDRKTGRALRIPKDIRERYSI